jgi:hypothetical protein
MCKASAKQTSANVISAGGMLGFISGEFGKFRRLVEASRSQRESPIQVPKTHSVFHPLAQRDAFRCRGARQQSRSFARWNQSLRRSPRLQPALPHCVRAEVGIGASQANYGHCKGKPCDVLILIPYNGGMTSDAEKKAHAQLAEFMTKGF